MANEYLPRQLERWQLLPDSALCERVIAYLDVDIIPSTIGEKESRSFYHIAQLLSAIARKSPQVKVTLQLEGGEIDSKLLSTGIKFPRVCRAIVAADPEGLRAARGDYWSFFLGGHVFPDLCQLETSGFHISATQPLLTIEEQLVTAEEFACEYSEIPGFRADVQLERLQYIHGLKIEGDVMLNRPLLLSLFGSATVPARLTTLEIVNCPMLFFAANLSNFSTLLQRSFTTLPALNKLKLHIIEDPHLEPGMSYQALQNHSHHLCNVVRVLGQNIQHLDLALPYACNRMFVPPKPALTYTHSAYQHESRGLPNIQREPLETLPQRLIAQGFKYRRLICWYGICFEQHDWEAMISYASVQGAGYSWEIICDEADQASWHVGEHDAVHFVAGDVISQPH